MIEKTTELIRSSVRPIVTVGFGAAFVAACFYNAEAAKELAALTTLVIGFWFKDRQKPTP